MSWVTCGPGLGVRRRMFQILPWKVNIWGLAILHKWTQNYFCEKSSQSVNNDEVQVITERIIQKSSVPCHSLLITCLALSDRVLSRDHTHQRTQRSTKIHSDSLLRADREGFNDNKFSIHEYWIKCLNHLKFHLYNFSIETFLKTMKHFTPNTTRSLVQRKARRGASSSGRGPRGRSPWGGLLGWPARGRPSRDLEMFPGSPGGKERRSLLWVPAVCGSAGQSPAWCSRTWPLSPGPTARPPWAAPPSPPSLPPRQCGDTRPGALTWPPQSQSLRSLLPSPRRESRPVWGGKVGQC